MGENPNNIAQCQKAKERHLDVSQVVEPLPGTHTALGLVYYTDPLSPLGATGHRSWLAFLKQDTADQQMASFLQRYFSIFSLILMCFTAVCLCAHILNVEGHICCFYCEREKINVEPSFCLGCYLATVASFRSSPEATLAGKNSTGMSEEGARYLMGEWA